jgi:hypothetical protein
MKVNSTTHTDKGDMSQEVDIIVEEGIEGEEDMMNHMDIIEIEKDGMNILLGLH